MPAIIQTSIVSSAGIAPHQHSIKTNESLPFGWNQITGISVGHSHTLRWNTVSGTIDVSEELGHTHSIII
jgi:hypothetical protein